MYAQFFKFFEKQHRFATELSTYLDEDKFERVSK